MRRMLVKKLLATLCAAAISISCVVNSVGAIDTTNAEFKFSLEYMNALPKEGNANFDRFTSLEYLQLKDEKLYQNVKYPNGKKDHPEIKCEDVTIKEKEVYNKIEKTVHDLEDKVDERTPGNEKYKGIPSKHTNVSREMRIAKAIYRWVAKKIPYDYDSLSTRKPQDPLFVYDKEVGVCAGKANLVNLMMRIAKIPCAVIVSNTHAFNAIYVKRAENDVAGWTLLDATWGAPKSDMSRQLGIEEIDNPSTKKDENEKDGVLNDKFIDFAGSDDFECLCSNILHGLVSDINKKLRDKSKRGVSREYGYKIKELFEKIIGEKRGELRQSVSKLARNEDLENSSKEIENIVSKINNEIKSSLKELNSNELEDIIKFEKIEVIFDKSLVNNDSLIKAFKVGYKFNLSEEEAKSLLSKDHDKMHEFFPAFYNQSIDFKTANEDIIDVGAHKFREIISCGSCDYVLKNENYYFNIESKKAKYCCYGVEGNAIIELEGDKKNPSKEVELLPNIAKCGLEIRVCRGIESIVLNGNTTLDFSRASDLKSVNTDHSDKYTSDIIAIYERDKNKPNQKGNIVKLFNNGEGTIGENGLIYDAIFNKNTNELTKVRLSCYKKIDAKVEIPEELRKLNVPIKIGIGIEALVLKGNDVVDLTDACSLDIKNVDVKDSNKYMKDDNGVLYEKVGEGQKGEKVPIYEEEELE